DHGVRLTRREDARLILRHRAMDVVVHGRSVRPVVPDRALWQPIGIPAEWKAVTRDTTNELVHRTLDAVGAMARHAACVVHDLAFRYGAAVVRESVTGRRGVVVSRANFRGGRRRPD